MERIRNNGLVYYQFEQLRYQDGLKHGIFTRRGGVSSSPYDSLNVGSTVGDDAGHVAINRQKIAATMGYPEAMVRTTWQVHGAEVLVVRKDDPQLWPPAQADALITNEGDIPLMMRFADCVPLLFFDPVQKAAGIAHAGWRGTIAGVGPAVVRRMVEEYGSRPQDMIAGIGPSIGPCCYEVGPEVVASVQDAHLPGWDDLVIPPVNGHGAHLDLWLANQRQLEAEGVGQIAAAQLCTNCHLHEFFSHRGEAGRTGRFGAVIMLGAKGQLR
jgi:hypothetical protein